jgi:hypothetical protein
MHFFKKEIFFFFADFSLLSRKQITTAGPKKFKKTNEKSLLSK